MTLNKTNNLKTCKFDATKEMNRATQFSGYLVREVGHLNHRGPIIKRLHGISSHRLSRDAVGILEVSTGLLLIVLLALVRIMRQVHIIALWIEVVSMLSCSCSGCRGSCHVHWHGQQGVVRDQVLVAHIARLIEHVVLVLVESVRLASC